MSVECLERRELLAAEAFDYRPPVSNDGVWSELSVREPVRQGPSLPGGSMNDDASISYLRAEEYLIYAMDLESLVQQLSSSEPVVEIPNPDGGFERYRVEPSSVMSPELAAKFPSIQSYAGVGVDTGASLRLDVSPIGFHAQVISRHESWYVDPYYHLEDQYFASYRSSSVPSPARRMHGDVEDHVKEHFEQHLEASSSDVPVSAASSSGSVLRTYRTAIAATGEYTNFFGGTVEAAQAAIVAAVNRVSGIYESELSIRFELVANNDLLVYTNAATDPYQNEDTDAELVQNQANIDSVIGNNNYDIGHVFVTVDAGYAALNSVGVDDTKAMGITGSSTPIGDSFYVDFVAHEIGHQFGGHHTFSGDSLACNGNFSLSAFEPGSGSTIMAYAGICGDDDIQAYSDPYFHFHSLDQIVDHVDTRIPGVGVRTETGNAIPTVDGGNDYIIPARTPFSLAAVGSDSDSDDVLTYAWEQADVGLPRDVSAPDNGFGPLFRSFLPTTDPTRTFPRLSDLIAGTTTIGEQLPTTTRELNFRVTVRDNRPGGGAINGDDVRLNVVDTGAAFAVQFPNGGENLNAAQIHSVTWDVAGTTGNGIDTPNVDVFLSLDGGQSFPIALASGVPNDGSHEVVMPDLYSNQARIKVVGASNIFFDISDAEFSIGTPGESVCSAYENFDGVSAPNLPAGWTSDATGAGVEWITVSAGSQSDPNHAFAPNVANVGSTSLVSPLMPAPHRIIFRHDYELEQSYDGGVLEISVDGGPYTDILNDSGSLLRGSYTGVLPSEYDNPLGGRLVWTGDSNGYIETEAELPPAAVGKQTQFRWRIGTDNQVDDIGWRIDSIQTCSQVDLGTDFGDAPDSYATRAASGGASHSIGGLLHLGSLVDADVDGQPSATATRDDSNGQADEDGIALPATLPAGTLVTISATASAANGLLQGWVDFNRDGDWDDLGEQVFQNQPLQAGLNSNLGFQVPADAVGGETYARFRFSTQSGVASTGPAVDGEVEDYRVHLAVDASLSGVKYHDLDGDGVRDGGEPGVEGFTIFLDANANGFLDQGERSTITAADGSYSFNDIDPAVYRVAELTRAGWAPTFLPVAPVTIASTEPTDMALVDIDGGGILDVLVVAPDSDAVVRMIGDGSGGFVRATDAVLVGGRPTAITVGDFDGVNGFDFATANFNGDSLSLALNSGSGDFTVSTAATFSGGDAPNVIASGMLSTDGDSDTDLFTSLTLNDEWQVFANDGSGEFENATLSTTSFVDFARDTAVANFDNDSRDDVVVAYANTDNVHVVLNPADALGSSVLRLAVGDVPAGVAAADFNGDGFQDIVTANRDSGDVSILMNLATGDGTFATAVGYAAGNTPVHVVTGDFNRDGAPDLVVANRSTDKVSLIFNRGDGTFASPISYDVGDGPESVAAADVNGDGFDDLVVVNKAGKSLSVLINAGYQVIDVGPGENAQADFGNRQHEQIAPSVASFVINEGARQRSSIVSARVELNTWARIDNSEADHFVVKSLITNEVVPTGTLIRTENGRTVVDLVFLPSGYLDESGSLIDGRYQLEIAANRISVDGLNLDGNGDGTGGDSYSSSDADKFFRKFGDDDGDDVVTLLDFAALRRTYGKDVGDPGYLSHMNVDAATGIGLTDFARFRRNFGS